MAKERLTIIDSFIHINYKDIYNEICFGCVNQDRKYYEKLKERNNKITIPTWNKKPSNIDVLESIYQFFHLCLNASKIDKDNKKIEEWILAQIKIACAQQSHGIVSSYKHTVLINSSEQVTKYLFSCLSWGIGMQNNSKSISLGKNLAINENFDSRILFYKDFMGMSDKTCHLLYAMKEMRNASVHTVYDFYTNRIDALNQLRYLLYDYITIFYMITHECVMKDKNGLPLTGQNVEIKKEVIDKLGNIDIKTNIDISIECDENGESVPERVNDIRLGLYGSPVFISPKSKDAPNIFEVKRFSTYEISLITNGATSQPSEPFMIDEGFVNGSIIRVNIPPQGSKPTPEKISIQDLILYQEQDLPDDLKFILEEMEHYPSQHSEFVRAARALVLASATNNEIDRKAFEDTVCRIREQFEKDSGITTHNNVSQILTDNIELLQANITSAYKGEKEFKEMCDMIDSFYSNLDFFNASSDKNKTAAQQVQEAVKNFLEGKGQPIGTKSTADTIETMKEYARLEFILSMHDKYPQIIETELGEFWIWSKIDNLYFNQITENVDLVLPLWEEIIKFQKQVTRTEDLKNADEERTKEYATLLRDMLNDVPNNTFKIIHLFSETLLFWLENCKPIDEDSNKTKENCKDLILQLRENRDIQISFIPVNNEEAKELNEQYHIFKKIINELNNRLIAYHYNFETICQKKKAELRVQDKIINRIFDNNICPEETIDVLSEVRFNSILQIVNSYGPENFMQFICCSENCSYIIGWLLECSMLGISPDGLFDEWSDEYHKWEKQNKELLTECQTIKNDLYKKFSKRERRRIGDDYYSNQQEVENMHASQIVSHQIRQIEQNYKGSIPDYIIDIRDASEIVLPYQAKANILKHVLVPSDIPSQNLILLIDGVLDYWGCASSDARGLLIEYISGKYGKRLLSEEIQSQFNLLSKDVKQIYIRILLRRLPIGTVADSTRYLLAYKLNSSEGNGKELIPTREIVMGLAKLKQSRIWHFDNQEFQDSLAVIKIVEEYVKNQPQDKEITEMSNNQKESFLNTCQEYLNKHLKVTSIDKGKRPDWKFGYLHKELKGKSKIDQLVAKYVSLYTEEYHDYIFKKWTTTIKYKSGWCDTEREIFYDIINLLSEESPLHQEEICKLLLFYICSSIKISMPFYDVRALRLFELKPFCSQQYYNKELNDFYTDCVYGCINISNPSVIDGLFNIRQLFDKYGQNVKVLFDAPSTSFIDLLISIYNYVEDTIKH